MIDWVNDRIAISEYPSSKVDLGQFDGVLNLDKFTPYHHDGIHHVHLPIIDGPGNTPEQIVEVLDRLDKLVRRGKVLVHCAAGVSRSPFIIALYLAWKSPLGFEEALDVVARHRSRPLNVDEGLVAMTGDVVRSLERAAGL